MSRYIPGLEKRKELYDSLLKEKELEKRSNISFREDKYQVYFLTEEDASIGDMSEEDRNAYDSGQGGELKERINKYGNKIPPSMFSVASSSRFCYLSLRDSDLDVFNIRNIITKRRFEEKLPVFEKGIPPHMDAYCETEKEVCFFECKCHEQFDSHPIVLSKSYFNKGFVVDSVFKGIKPIGTKQITKDNGEKVEYPIFPSNIFGVSDNPRFDIKQLLTHLMGIKKRMENFPEKKARLIYFYFIPNYAYKKPQIKEIIDLLFEESKSVFKHIEKHEKEISLELYVQYSDIVQTAAKDNVVQIYPKDMR